MWPFSLLALVMVHCTWSYRHNNMCMICICKASSQTSDTWPTPENTSKNEYRSVKSRLLIHLRQSTLVNHHAADNNMHREAEGSNDYCYARDSDRGNEDLGSNILYRAGYLS